MSTSCRSTYLRSSPVNYSQSHRSTLPLCILYFPFLQNTFLFYTNLGAKLLHKPPSESEIYTCINECCCCTFLYFYIRKSLTLQIVKDRIELVGLLLNWWVCHHSWQCEPGQDLTNVDFLARMIYKSASHNWRDEGHSKFTFSTIFAPKKHLKHLY